MKLVIQVGGETTVRYVPEFAIKSTIDHILAKYQGRQITPLPYEVFRYKLENGVIFLTKTRRRDMTKKRWFETRALSLLAQELNESFQRNIMISTNSHKMEVDGVGIKSGTIVEVTRTKINQKWLEFYDKKRRTIGITNLLLIASDFSRDIDRPPGLQLYKVNLDWEIVKEHYRSFSFPSWFLPVIAKRHVRFLLYNGQWKCVGRSLTPSAKHTPDSKFRKCIEQLWNNPAGPVKVYYSQSSMVNPPREYRGKGYPMNKVVMAFDIDSNSHTHQIESEGYCKLCLIDAEKRLKLAEECLHGLGYETVSLYSGTKGFHIYCFNDSKLVECDIGQYEEVLVKLGDITDSFTFRGKNESYDIHRILKLPGSVECETGLLIEESVNRLQFNDSISEI